MKVKPEISKKQNKFLTEFLKTKTLLQWMPYYVAAVSKERKTYSVLPPDLLDALRNELNPFLESIGGELVSSEHTYSEDEMIRYLTGISDEEFLIKYGKSIKGDNFHLSEIPADIAVRAIGMLAELRQIITGENGLFSKDFDLEPFVDQFIYAAGGKRVTDLIEYDPANTPDNADYYFELFNVIIELKLIKTDHLEEKAEKIKARKNKILELAETDPSIDVKQRLARVEFDILRSSLTTATKSANRQIKNTRKLLKKSRARGFVFFINDGFYSVNPYDLIELLWDPIKRDFSGIYGIFWANFRRLAEMESGINSFIFEQRTRGNNMPFMSYFINWFGARWLDYPYSLVGTQPAERISSANPLNLKKATWKKDNQFE